MVRNKQSFPTDAPCSTTSLHDSDGLQAPEKSGQTGSKLPVKKAIEPVQSSGKQKRPETNFTNIKKNNNDVLINLDEIEDISFSQRCCINKSRSHLAERKAKQREKMGVNEKDREVEMNRIRIGLKRAQMTEDETEEEREENRTRIGLKRVLMVDCDRIQYAFKRTRMTDEDLERERESNRSNKYNIRKSLKRDFDQLFSVAGDHKMLSFTNWDNLILNVQSVSHCISLRKYRNELNLTS